MSYLVICFKISDNRFDEHQGDTKNIEKKYAEYIEGNQKSIRELKSESIFYPLFLLDFINGFTRADTDLCSDVIVRLVYDYYYE